MSTPDKNSARRKLELSQLNPLALSQRQGFGDVNVQKLHLMLDGQFGADLSSTITDIRIKRTIEGASTLTISVTDDKRTLLRSGRLTSKVDFQIDGLWFRFQQLTKSGPDLTLLCEDREVAILRTYYSKLGPISRDKISRAQFVLRMIREVKEFKLAYFIPELITVQPIKSTKDTQSIAPDHPAAKRGLPTDGGNAGAGPIPPRITGKEPGLGSTFSLTVKGTPMTDTQAKNANIVLATGESQNARRKVLVASIMVAIQESSISNLAGGPTTTDTQGVEHIHKGIYQQDPLYWPASGDVGTDAAAFFERCIGIDRKYPNLTYFDLGEQVQRSGQPQAYASWRTEAEHIVSAYGLPGGDLTGIIGSSDITGPGPYFFYRGLPPTKAGGRWGNENSWTALQRMASDVNWRAFSSAGTIFFLTEDWLFKSQPVHRLSESSRGVLDISGDIDNRKLNGIITMEVLMKRWAAPPGSMIELFDCGPFDGKWLVSETDRSLYSERGTITLKQPGAALPEPADPNLTAGGSISNPPIVGPQETPNYQAGTTLINPIAPGFGSVGSPGPIHTTEGLGGTNAGPNGVLWPRQDALDFSAPATTPVLAVESGKIVRFSGHDPFLGPVAGVHGPFAWSIYLQGLSGALWYYTHLDTRTVGEGIDVSIGDQVGTVADYAKWGGSNHVHIGCCPPFNKHPNIIDLGSSPQALVAGQVKTTPPDVVDDQNKPLFTQEGPQFYADAYAHNKPFAVDGPYVTVLAPAIEAAFRKWVTEHGVPVDPDESPSDYDMRGFYLSMNNGKYPNWHGGHFPDEFKTPYDTSFSKESKYATPNCPFVWRGNILVDSRNNQIIFKGVG